MHEFNVGVTEIVAVPTAEGVNEAILPLPVEVSPMDELLFDQVKVLPVDPEKLIAVEACPKQNDLLPGEAIVGAGLIVAKTAERVELHPLVVACT